MSLTIKGDFAALTEIGDKLRGPRQLLQQCSKAMAEETVDLVKEGFRTETDPYGDPWAPKARDDGRKVLSGKTSRLKTGWKVETTTDGFYDVSASVEYAEYHQSPRKRTVRRADGRFGRGNGRLKRPKRMMVPEASKGLPRDWSEALEEVAADAVTAFYRVK